MLRLALATALVLAACIPSPPRAPRALGSIGGVIVSNSPTRIERHEPTVASGQLAVDYSLLFENRGKDELRVETAKATAKLAETPIQAACARHDQPGATSEIVVSPGARLRVDCRLTAAQGASLLASQGDQDMVLVLPVLRSGDDPAELGTLTFRYPLRAEDAK